MISDALQVRALRPRTCTKCKKSIALSELYVQRKEIGETGRFRGLVVRYLRYHLACSNATKERA